jgi:hypothetical protein
MKDEDWIVMNEKFRSQYPYDFAIVTAISQKYKKIRKDIFQDSDIEEGQSKNIIVGITKRIGQQEPNMMLNDEGLALLAAITEVISEGFIRMMFSKEFAAIYEQKAKDIAQKLILSQSYQIKEQSFKRCRNCSLENDWNADYCKKCGTKL